MEDTDMNWRKASYSNGGENCVEVANAEGVAVRDTKDRGGVTSHVDGRPARRSDDDGDLAAPRTGSSQQAPFDPVAEPADPRGAHPSPPPDAGNLGT
jgi:hypothetical protein